MHVRLGKNLGRYHGEPIPIDRILAETHAAALGHGWECDTFLDSAGITLRAYRRQSAGARTNLYLSTGVHGDEPSGPLALLRILRENRWPDANLWVMPCLNPAGFRLNTRENQDGIDLNRDYRHLQTAEVRAHVGWLRAQPRFDLSLLLHEDWEANGFYVYELNPQNRPSIAEAVIGAVRENCPIEPTGRVDDFDCVGGVIRPQIHPEDRPQWAEALYLRMNNAILNYTLETPSDFPLAMRAGVHTLAVREALRAFYSPPTSA